MIGLSDEAENWQQGEGGDGLVQLEPGDEGAVGGQGELEHLHEALLVHEGGLLGGGSSGLDGGGGGEGQVAERGKSLGEDRNSPREEAGVGPEEDHGISWTGSSHTTCTTACRHPRVRPNLSPLLPLFGFQLG